MTLAGSTGALMVVVLIVLGIENPRGFDTEWGLVLLVALLPCVMIAFVPSGPHAVVRHGTLHVVLMVGLAALYLIGAGTFGFVYAVVLYFGALANSIVGIANR